MSSTLQAHSGIDTNQLQREIQSNQNLKHVTPPNENLSATKDAVIQQAATEGASHLHHVNPPREGLSEGVKNAYLEDHNAGKQRGGKQCCGSCGKCSKDNCKCDSSCKA